MDPKFQNEKCPARMKDQRSLGTDYTPNREMNKAHNKEFNTKNSHEYRNHIQLNAKKITDKINLDLRVFECNPVPKGHGPVEIKELKQDFGSF